MSTLNYLNLGCGTHYSPQWINVDFSKTGEGVIAHNLINGVPFDDNLFDVVYHSHVLEHFAKDDGIAFIKECYRVLKPGGIIRIALPDLEQITVNYLRLLNAGKQNTTDETIRADYDWIITEMYDQTVRNSGGGNMSKYLTQEILANEDFIYSRIGHEGRMIRKGFIEARDTPREPVKVSFIDKILGKIKRNAAPKNYRKIALKIFFKKEYQLMQLAQFRQSGEIHQWMYDIYSAGNLLKDAGFKNITKMDFDKSAIPAWRSYELDEINNVVRKPDSLFIEAIK